MDVPLRSLQRPGRYIHAHHPARPEPWLRLWIVVLTILHGVALVLPADLPVVPVADLHTVWGQDQVATADTVGWPQLTREVAAQDAALVRAGEPPTSIFAGDYGEAGALDVLEAAARSGI